MEQKPQLISSSRPFFVEMVEHAVKRQKIQAPATTKNYLVDVLEFYMLSTNLFATNEPTAMRATLAETYLVATSAEPTIKAELLKRLGDTSLYISGFFGDSLHRKIVDVDYYAEIGGSAYGTLAKVVNPDHAAPVYEDLAQHFLDYVDVLTFISQQSLVQTDEDILRLYNRYLATGSKLAEQQLLEKGVLASPLIAKAGKQ